MKHHKSHIYTDPVLDKDMESIAYNLRNLDAQTAKLTSLPTYANNTAALAGGLKAGQVYKTSTGVLMVTY